MRAGKPSPFKVQASPLLLITVALLAVLFAVRSLFVVLLVRLPVACPLILSLKMFNIQQMPCMASTAPESPTMCCRQPQKGPQGSDNGSCMSALSDCCGPVE